MRTTCPDFAWSKFKVKWRQDGLRQENLPDQWVRRYVGMGQL